MRLSQGLAEQILNRLVDAPEWMQEAACRDTDLNPFDPESKQEFVKLCRECPVLQQCGDMVEGLETEPSDGVFAGIIYGEE